jgi:hypothetical protein
MLASIPKGKMRLVICLFCFSTYYFYLFTFHDYCVPLNERLGGSEEIGNVSSWLRKNGLNRFRLRARLP